MLVSGTGRTLVTPDNLFLSSECDWDRIPNKIRTKACRYSLGHLFAQTDIRFVLWCLLLPKWESLFKTMKRWRQPDLKSYIKHGTYPQDLWKARDVTHLNNLALILMWGLCVRPSFSLRGGHLFIRAGGLRVERILEEESSDSWRIWRCHWSGCGRGQLSSTL